MTEQSAARGIKFVIVATLFFAFQDGISKHLADRYPVPFFVMIRYWFFGAFVVVLASRRPGGVRAACRTRMPLLQAFRGVLLVVQIFVFVTALHLMGISAMMSIFSLYPLLIMLLAMVILKERVGWRRLAAVGVGFAGVLVILRPGAGVFDWTALVGLLAAFGIAVYSILTRIATRADGDSAPAVFYTGVFGAIAATLVGPFFWTEMPLTDWGLLIVLCICGMGGHYFLIRAYDATEAARIQPFAYLQMVFGVLIGWTIFGEPFDLWMVLGMAMIIAAGLYAIWREYRVTGLRR